MRLRSTILIATSICCLLMADSNGYRILGIFIFPVHSHYFLGSSLLKGLAEEGHDITIISSISQKSPPKNGTWKEIVLNSIRVTYERNCNLFSSSKLTLIQQWLQYLQFFKYLTETTLNSSEVQDLIHSNETFDAVITTELLMPSMTAFAAHFKAQLITFSNFVGYNYYHSALNVPSLPSHFPEYHLDNFHHGKLSYFHRLKNSFRYIVRTSLYSYYMFPHQVDLVKKHFPNVPDLEDIVRNTSLVLVNSHSSTNYLQPKIPIMVDIGGFHLKPPQRLPDNLQSLLDNAKNGVIYFSMGSNMKPEHLPKETIDIFLKVFAARKELILWLCPETILPEKPDNLILGEWFPQQDILAHPNVKLFITHGGFLSLTETIYNGVPIIVIPLSLDQIQNALFLADNGLGLRVNLDDMTEESLSYAIEDITSNPKYKRAAEERSLILKDRIKPPMEEAIYWVEYVIRHKGAKHLKLPYLGMPWYQFYLVDIIVPFFLGLILGLWLMTKLLVLLFGILRVNKKIKTM